MKPTLAGLILSAAMLAACGAIPNKHAADKVDAGQAAAGTGIAILSTGAPERCFTTATFLKVLPASKKYGSWDSTLVSVDGYAVPSDFTTHHGYLNAIVLPEGDYYLAEWIANPYVAAVKVSKADFSIRAGEVVYLGEFFKPVSCTLAPSSQFRDQQERDFALLTKKNPRFDTARIVKRIARFSGYAVGAPE